VRRERGIVWLTDGVVAPVLRYRADALVVVGGPSGAGKSTLAARVFEDPDAVLDADTVRAELAGARGVEAAAVDWPAALERTRADYLERLERGNGAVLVATAVRRGHRLGLAKDAAAAGVSLHLLMLDADLELCRAGRAAQESERISDGLFEHLVYEWIAFRGSLERGEDLEGVASVTVLDRPAVDALERVERYLPTFSRSARG
jgi:predicted kinase